MQEKRNEGRCDKVAYESIADAHVGAKQIRAYRKVKFRVYKCPFCYKFHLTSIKNKKLPPDKKLKYPYLQFIKNIKQKK